MRVITNAARALALAVACGLPLLGFGVGSGFGPGAARAAEEALAPPHQDWTFNGVFGTYDRAAAQRGYQVYKEVCATCHAMRLLAFRNLRTLGYSEDEVKAFAAQYQVTAGPNDQGEMFQRPALPSDHFVAPFANEQAARAANNGAYPPDLTLMAKAREGGPDYIYAFLTGFRDAPADITMMPGMNYNLYFPGHQVAMPNILNDNAVTYQDGTQATKQQQAWDVVNFLMWTAEPHLEQRKQMGVKVVLFLIAFSGMMYAVKRKVWADVH